MRSHLAGQYHAGSNDLRPAPEWGHRVFRGRIASSYDAGGESKSDYEIVLEIAKKMGMAEAVSEGKSVEDWIAASFENQLGKKGVIGWEEFKDKGYYVYPIAEDWEKDPAGLIEFYEDPVKNPLPTPSGKLEFYSERIAKAFPHDRERASIPKWIEKSETHDERISSDRPACSPAMMSNHGRWRVHAQCDDISWSWKS
jgi:trimethylamine-N-oxide reductase (cytochrome c)